VHLMYGSDVAVTALSKVKTDCYEEVVLPVDDFFLFRSFYPVLFLNERLYTCMITL
jgi:hypothetical protein